MIKCIYLQLGANTVLNIEHRGNLTKVRDKTRMSSIPTVLQFSSGIFCSMLYIKRKKWGVNFREGKQIYVWRKYLHGNIREETWKTLRKQ